MYKNIFKILRVDKGRGLLSECLLKKSDDYILFQLLRQSSTSLSEKTQSEQISERKLLKVAIVGLPNSGKSTLINKIIKLNMCDESPKTHTTRVPLKAAFNCGNTQVVFVDTPGIVTKQDMKKFNLHKNFKNWKYSIFKEVDIIGLIYEAPLLYMTERFRSTMLANLSAVPRHVKMFLIVNKIDLLSNKSRIHMSVKKLLDPKNSKKLRESSESSKLSKLSESSQLSESSELSESLKLSQLSGSSESSKLSKSVDFSEPSKSSEFSKLSEWYESSEHLESSESSESVQSAKLSELCESSEHLESSESSESVQSAKLSESCESTELSEWTEPSKSSASLATVHKIDKTKLSDYFLVSALNGEGVQDLVDYLLSQAKPNDWLFEPGKVSDVTLPDLIVSLTRAKFLKYFPFNVPYECVYEIEYLEEKDYGDIVAVILVTCKSKNHRKLIVYNRTHSLKTLSKEIEFDLYKIIGKIVRLRVVVERNIKGL